MSFNSWLKNLRRLCDLGSGRPSAGRTPPRRRSVSLCLEQLETRLTPSLSTLASFASGAGSFAPVVMDGSGNLYGTTQYGGASGYGSVFELAQGSGAITTLASFNAFNGAHPNAGLIMDGSGDLFGTATTGSASTAPGASGDGTVFELVHGSGTITALASFNGANGQRPEAALIMDGSGNLYGTTIVGGASNGGTVFELAQGSGTITTLASFNGYNGANGAYPEAALVMDGSGNLYGTTSFGGASGDGTVFELAHGSSTITTLVTFNGPNGAEPNGALVMDGNGNLYGTTSLGGNFDEGAVFELAHGSGTITTLASFNGYNGNYPESALIMGVNGNLYGTTLFGGASDSGTVFELAHGSGTITTLVTFNGPNGAEPNASLVMDGNGNMYGTTVYGGASSDGTVFELTSPVTFALGYPSSATAGAANAFIVTAENAAGSVYTGYTGTVHFTSSDPQAVLPADYNFTAADKGVHTFSATLMTAGAQWIAAIDTATSGSLASATNITVNPAALSTFNLSGYPAPTNVGLAGSFTVTGLDAYGNITTNYIGTVHFTSSDAKAGLPANYTFTAADAGVNTFSATLNTTGMQSLTVTDIAKGGATGSQTGITVDPAGLPAKAFRVSGFPSPTTNGVAGAFTVTAIDANGKVAPTYRGTVHFSSSDAQAGLPADYTFTNADQGVHTFSATLKTVGAQSITAADTATGADIGSETGITVNPFMVLNLNDSGAGSLRAAVAAANALPGFTIGFVNGLSGTIKLTSGELLISASVTINGPGANKLSVSGNNASRVFEIEAGSNVTINGLTVTKGYAPDQGGGILNDGSNLTLSGDNLTQNVAFESGTGSDIGAAEGGGLQNQNGNLTITGCQITGNQALGAAGASEYGDADGGGISIVGGGEATISGSTISGNVAQGGANSSDGAASGGGVAGGGSINNCTISGNVAQGGNNSGDGNGEAFGGGLATEGFVTTITGTTFKGNQAVGGNGGTGNSVGTSGGGAVSGSVTVSGSAFNQNLAQGGSGGNSGQDNADPYVDYAFGGAIQSFGGGISVTNSTFSHNEALGGNNAAATGTDIVLVGGAEGGAVLSQFGSTASFSGCAFNQNLAQGGSGNSGSGPVVLVGEGLGGAINSGYDGALTVSNCTITHNNAQGGDNNSGSASVAGLVGAGAGAGIANYAGGTAAISGSELDHGQATGGRHNTASGAGAVFAGLGAGGGVFNYLGNYNSSSYGQLNASVVTISGCTLDHNQAQGGGGGNAVGGGIADMVGATTTVDSSTITQNQVNGSCGGAGLGGGVYNDATSSLTLQNHTSVTHNQANGSLGNGGGVYSAKGGAFSYDSTTDIDDNQASTSGNDIDTTGP